MYFDFEDNRPDTPTIAQPLSLREEVMLTFILHLLVVIAFLLGPKLPWVQAADLRRQQALEELRQRELERRREAQRFVFVQPRVDIRARKPPPVADLSDADRVARTVQRAPKPTNPLPFARGNSPERMEAAPAAEARRTEPPPQPAPAPTPDARPALTLPDSPTAYEPRSTDAVRQIPRGPAAGVIADAIRNVQKYAQKDSFENAQGGADQNAPSIQFDTKGVEFGPWLARFVAQIRHNWFIPYAAMSLRGHVVLTFYVHKDGRITDVSILRPSSIDAFTRSAQNAILSSNPTIPLPPEYPDDKAFFTVTFYFNENPSNQ